MKNKLTVFYISFFVLSCNDNINSVKKPKSFENFNHETIENEIADYDRLCEIPDHNYYIKEKINWDKEHERLVSSQDNSVLDNTMPKKAGVDMLDTMFILTKSKLILIRGLYSYFNNDTIRMPESGEFDINFNVMEKGKYQIGKTKYIYFNGSKYILHHKLEYQWWCLIYDKLEINQDNSIKVSGP